MPHLDDVGQDAAVNTLQQPHDVRSTPLNDFIHCIDELHHRTPDVKEGFESIGNSFTTAENFIDLELALAATKADYAQHAKAKKARIEKRNEFRPVMGDGTANTMRRLLWNF